jgi:hypothetical protein
VKASSPVLTPEVQPSEVVYAKDQPEYLPLPVLRSGDGKVLSRWTPTEAERKAIAEGADVLLICWTFNRPLQPLWVGINDSDTVASMAHEFL